MRMSEAKLVVKEWLKDVRYPPLVLVGGAGCGKSQTVGDCGRESELPTEILRLGSLDSPGDLLGRNASVDGVTTFEETVWYHNIKNGGILFIDEINRCKPVLMDSVMQILDTKRLHNYDLSKCHIICAMNPDTDEYVVNEFEGAMIDRCLCVKVNNTPEDAIQYMKENGFDESVIELCVLGEDKMKLSCTFDLPKKEWTGRGTRQLNDIMPVIAMMQESVGLELITACIGASGKATWMNKGILRDLPTAGEYIANADMYKVEDYDPLKRTVLLHRLDAHLKGHKIKDKKEFTKNILRFGKQALGQVLRHMKNIENRLDNSHEEFAKQSIEILGVLNGGK